MKVFCTNNSPGYASWLQPLGITPIFDPNKADILLITGGVDVNPNLYNQKVGRYTDTPEPARDKDELDLFYQFTEQRKPILGVCRGSQLLCVANGGELVQHSSHPHIHKAETYLGKEFICNSTHHQQALIRNVKNCELLAWANNLSKYHLNGDNKDYEFPSDYKEPEIVFYPATRSLGIQSHPEWMDEDCEWVKFCQQLVIEKCICHQ